MGTVSPLLMVGSTAMGIISENKQLQAQGRANVQQARNYVTSMNYSLQNLEHERSDAFDATVNDLMKIRMQGSRQAAMVNSAVNEELAGGGRTAALIKRSAEADINRAAESSSDNYARKSNEIDLNKEATLRNTKGQMASISNVESPSFLGNAMRLGASYIGAKQTADAISAIRGQAGVGKSAMQNTTQQTMLSNMNMYTDYKANAISSVVKNETDWLAPSRTGYILKNPYVYNGFKTYF